MKIYNRYILTVSLLLLLTTVILTAAGQNSLALYFTIYVVEALVVTELFRHLNIKARTGINGVGAVLFGGLGIVVTIWTVKLLL